ncbi:hypothetical protein V6N11_015626 [Hibiscus sabdariffa]|uniref:MATH domain-containing protein n=1 Tax=Hibiscus sabdariffa TaxID=183260 RepID=A0ABR2TSP8_9ROSI
MDTNSYSCGDIVRYRRDIPPAHYSFKIEAFSLLSDTKAEKIESGIFEAGGYKWRMVLFPNGNAKSNGKDFVSLYLAIEETKSLPQRWEVKAEIKLFVFDHKENNYLTVQGKQWFSKEDNSWGYRNTIRLGDLHEKSKGFVMNDTLIVEAQITLVSVTKFSP